MPSEESRKKFTDWFRKNYPQEYYFFHKIESNLDKLYSTKHLGLHEGEFAEISINVQKREGVNITYMLIHLHQFFLVQYAK
jgi:hypothetical protein